MKTCKTCKGTGEVVKRRDLKSGGMDLAKKKCHDCDGKNVTGKPFDPLGDLISALARGK